MKGICEELEYYGLKYVDGQTLNQSTEEIHEEEFIKLQSELDPEVGAVVVGIDFNFSYRKNCYASSYIQRGAHFIATNMDSNIKVSENLLLPGGGTCVEAIAKGVGKRPYVTGKPNPYIIDQICEQYGIQKSECLMVGDNLETDILFGVNAGIDTLLVFSGVTTPEKLSKSEVNPTYISDLL